MSSRRSKRQRLSKTDANNGLDGDSDLEEISATVWNSTRQESSGSISPPPARNSLQDSSVSTVRRNEKAARTRPSGAVGSSSTATDQKTFARRLVPSPTQLSTANGLAAASNVDTASLGDILGDPLIRECWLFNYLFDVDFVIGSRSQLDEDTRAMVQVKIVHGSWRKEDSNRIHIEVMNDRRSQDDVRADDTAY
ncbi:MAG: hypothetical protein Q9196_002745 [Gyalolechia fulgens]